MSMTLCTQNEQTQMPEAGNPNVEDLQDDKAQQWVNFISFGIGCVWKSGLDVCVDVRDGVGCVWKSGWAGNEDEGGGEEEEEEEEEGAMNKGIGMGGLVMKMNGGGEEEEGMNGVIGIKGRELEFKMRERGGRD
ncbi:hypothetical protein LWI29_012501 [Acer saccharum]|uniref:Uncharacterized protein n=1 Tax=Acer saccharum TaxID=4024 RepID=A0AA39S537_ACESA|nr:hypothetical protein LWI29_012501 [Acer saccharum]